jgi:hypothetical protein
MVRFATIFCVPRLRLRDIAVAYDRDDNSWQASGFGVESLLGTSTTHDCSVRRLRLDKPGRKF